LKVIRMWKGNPKQRRKSDALGTPDEAREPVITLAFLERTGNEPRHEELSLSNLNPTTTRTSSTVIIWNMKNISSMRFTFKTTKGKWPPNDKRRSCARR
jgi:hypothetical protein